MLEEIRKNYINEAEAVEPNWKNLDVNTLCNLYVENEKYEGKRSGYFACVLLKKWGYIGRNYTESKASGFSIEDCYDMVIEAVLYILTKKSWLDPSKSIYKDKNGPDKCLNRAIYSCRRKYYYLANMDKRKGNFQKISLDLITENVGDHTSILADDDYSLANKLNLISNENIEYNFNLNYYISTLFEKNKVLEGLIVDNICNDDCFVIKKTVDGYTKTFKLAKLISNLYKYDKKSLANIANRYAVSKEALFDVESILGTNKKTFSQIVEKTMSKLKSDNSLKEVLCY